MIANSAFITVGEPAKTLQAVREGRAPKAEYASFLEGNHFSEVLAMVDRGIDPGSSSSTMRFAVSAYRATWDRESIYLGEEFPGIHYLAVHALLRRRKRIGLLVHNVASMKRRVPLGMLRLGRLVDHIFCLSTRSREELETQYDLPSSRITVVGSRVDTDFFQPDPNTEPRAQVCSAGVVNRDYPTLIEAMRPIGVPLKIAADTAWQYGGTSLGFGTSPNGQANVSSLPAFVEMRSWGNWVNLRRLYAESALVVVPLQRSLLSGVTVALEGMAMGKAVVMTHSPYVEDFLRDRETGFFVRAGDADGLRKTIRHLLDRPDEAARVGAAARQWVLEKFTVERYVQTILSRLEPGR
jgi:glycosyltransferase involved in cell wall biosynthesis